MPLMRTSVPGTETVAAGSQGSGRTSWGVASGNPNRTSVQLRVPGRRTTSRASALRAWTTADPTACRQSTGGGTGLVVGQSVAMPSAAASSDASTSREVAAARPGAGSNVETVLCRISWTSSPTKSV